MIRFNILAGNFKHAFFLATTETARVDARRRLASIPGPARHADSGIVVRTPALQSLSLQSLYGS